MLNLPSKAQRLCSDAMVLQGMATCSAGLFSVPHATEAGSSAEPKQVAGRLT